MRKFSATRRPCITEEIPKSITGLRGKVFIHYILDEDAQNVDSVRFSEKGKDDSTLDNMVTEQGEMVTRFLRQMRDVMVDLERLESIPLCRAAVDWLAMPAGQTVDVTDLYASPESARAAVSAFAAREGIYLKTKRHAGRTYVTKLAGEKPCPT